MLELLADPVHELRLVGLVIWTERYRRRRTPQPERELIHRDYLAASDRVNNWDLVDLSAPTIVGRHLIEAGAGIGLLRRLARLGADLGPPHRDRRDDAVQPSGRSRARPSRSRRCCSATSTT